jgi:hypothetical protein
MLSIRYLPISTRLETIINVQFFEEQFSMRTRKAQLQSHMQKLEVVKPVKSKGREKGKRRRKKSLSWKSMEIPVRLCYPKQVSVTVSPHLRPKLPSPFVLTWISRCWRRFRRTSLARSGRSEAAFCHVEKMDFGSLNKYARAAPERHATAMAYWLRALCHCGGDHWQDCVSDWRQAVVDIADTLGRWEILNGDGYSSTKDYRLCVKCALTLVGYFKVNGIVTTHWEQDMSGKNGKMAFVLGDLSIMDVGWWLNKYTPSLPQVMMR